MSYAKVIAELVSRGEEDLAEELLSSATGATGGPPSEQHLRYIAGVFTAYVFGDDRKGAADDLRSYTKIKMPRVDMKVGGEFHKQAEAFHSDVMKAIKKFVKSVPWTDEA